MQKLNGLPLPRTAPAAELLGTRSRKQGRRRGWERHERESGADEIARLGGGGGGGARKMGIVFLLGGLLEAAAAAAAATTTKANGRGPATVGTTTTRIDILLRDIILKARPARRPYPL